VTLINITFLSVSSRFLLPFTFSYIRLKCFSFCVGCQDRSCCIFVNYKVKYSLLFWRHLTSDLLSAVMPLYTSFYLDSYCHFDTLRSHLAERFFLRSMFCHILHVVEYISLFFIYCTTKQETSIIYYQIYTRPIKTDLCTLKFSSSFPSMVLTAHSSSKSLFCFDIGNPSNLFIY